MNQDQARQHLFDRAAEFHQIAMRLLRAKRVPSPEDGAQIAFRKAQTAIEQGQFRGNHSQLIAWFVAIVHHVAMDSFRSHDREKSRIAGALDTDPVDPKSDFISEVSHSEELARLREAMGRLPEPERTAVRMRIAGLSNKAIAEQLKIREGSISALFRNVLILLKREMTHLKVAN